MRRVLLPTAIFLCSAATVLASAGIALFENPVEPIPGEPAQVATADFDGDGREDLLFSSFETNRLAVLLGNGSFSFDPVVTDLAGQIGTAAILGVAADDLNGDDRIDVVFTQANEKIWLLFGNGDATFQAPTSLTPGGALQITQVAIDDVTGDGDDDIAAAYEGGVIVLPGNDDGTFDPATLVNTGSTSWGLLLADVDGDTDIDLVTGSRTAINRGGGIFTETRTHPVAATGVGLGIALEDLDDDGLPDLLVPASASQIAVMLANGTGGFGSATLHFVGSSPNAIAVEDLDGDDVPDVIVSNNFQRELSYLRGLGGGSLAPAVDVLASQNGGPFVLEDFDADGSVDIGFGSQLSDGFNIVRGDGDGNFLESSNRRRSSGGGTVALSGRLLDDVSGDSVADLTLPISSANEVRVFAGLGDGNFDEPVAIAVGTSPSVVVSASIDADGLPDLVVLNDTDASLIRTNGDGTYQPESRLAFGPAPLDIAIADADGASGLDALVLQDGAPGSVQLFLGDGLGGFAAGLSAPVGDDPTRLIAADLNDDGFEDAVVANGASDDLSILIANGDGTFQAESRLALPVGVGLGAIGDVTGDGDADIVLVGQLFGVLPGDGAGGFGSFVAGPAQKIVNADLSAELADVDLDGRLDIVTGGGLFTFVRLNDGKGGFAEPQAFALEGSVRPAVGDLDGDTRPDLVTAASQIVAALNQGPMKLVFAGPSTGVGAPAAFATGYQVVRGNLGDLIDLNDDGAADGGYGACLVTGLAPADRTFTDADVPLAGAGFFYLWAAADGPDAGQVGSSTGGTLRAPASPCN